MENKGILVYCITDKCDDSINEIVGMDGINKLYYIMSNDLYAITSDVDLEEYGEDSMAEKSEDVEWLKEKATIFMDIILKTSVTSSIIPMKFLTIFTSCDRVKSIINDNLDQFLHNFEIIKNREELSVKIYCDDKVYKENIMGDEIRKFEQTLVGKPKGAAFFLKKKFEGELDDKISNRICDAANSFANKISNYAVEMKSNKTLAKEISGVDIPMILNCAYLVDRDQKEKMSTRIDELTEEYEKDGFRIEFSGPWPPYNFCE